APRRRRHAPCSGEPNDRTSYPAPRAADPERVVASLRARSPPGLPEVRAGDDLAALIVQALAGDELRDGQVVAIAHKVVSKAEGAVVALAQGCPLERARALAAARGKDARAVQVVLDESVEVLRAERGV